MDEGKENELQQPIFLGLTKPPMLWGAPLEWVTVSFFLTAVCFLLFNELKYIGLFIPFHGLGYALSVGDPHRVIVFIRIVAKVRPLHSKRSIGGNRYFPD